MRSSWALQPSQKAWSSGPGCGSGRRYSTVSSISVSPQDDRAARIRGAGDDAAARPRHLARRALVFVAKLAHGLVHQVHAPHVALGQVAAGGVDRQRAAQLDAAVLDEGPPLPLGAEAEVLDLRDHGEGEAVVEL